MALIDDDVSGREFEENKRALLAYSKRVDCPQNWHDDNAARLALRLLGFREDALCNYVLATSPLNGARRLRTR